MDFKGKTALITGASGELGQSVAKYFVERGANVGLVYFSTTPEGKRCKAETSDNTLWMHADVRSLADMESVAKAMLKKFGSIDILVPCAGIARHAPIDEMTAEDWSIVMDISATGTFNACKVVTPTMKNNNFGRIVTVSSIGGRTGRPKAGVNYAAAKAAVIGISMQLAHELGPWNITVNSVAPGLLAGKMFFGAPQDEIDAKIKAARIARVGTMEEVAGTIGFLCGDDGGWITGEVLDINGGMYI